MMKRRVVGRSSKRVSAVGESERAGQFIDMAQLLGDSCFEDRHHHHHHHHHYCHHCIYNHHLSHRHHHHHDHGPSAECFEDQQTKAMLN